MCRTRKRSEELRALIQTLQVSVDRGLNCALTPKDCRLLLTVIFSRRNNPKPADRFIHEAAEWAADLISSLRDELKE